MNFKRFLSLALAFMMVFSICPMQVFAAENSETTLPTATVTEINKDDLTFALNFKADAATEAQLAHYGDWYADFELTVNKDVTFNADGGADGYLSGQYDAWSENWVNVPFEDVTLKAGESLKIMAYAAETLGQSGLKLTYADVYNSVKDFDCGVFFESDFLIANPDLKVTLELKMYNPADESESYTIGKTYEYTVGDIKLPGATVSEIENDELTFAMNFKADEVTDAQLAYYGDWYADFELTVNKDVTLNANGGADGYLSGQYDAWSENWVNVPFEDVTLEADKPLKIMECASELMGQSGLKLTYADVYNSVKDFDCGVFFEPAFLAANPDLKVTLELRMYNPENENESYTIGKTYEYTATEVSLPTATVTKIKNENLTFALNFEADDATDAQLAKFGDWYADFELTVNKDVTFNADGGADGYLSGQYDAWSENWVNVPFEDVTLKAGESLKIMAYAAETLGQSGLKLTYADVYNSVKDFDCGVFFEPEFLAANPDLVVTLELRMYNPADESESYVIGKTYEYSAKDVLLPTATVTEIVNEDLTFAMNFKADEVTEEQLEYYSNWYADFELTVNKDVTLNANGGADGYLSGQYDAWSENWVNVPFENVTLKAGETLKIMEYASELMGKPGLKYTYGEVYEVVKDFDCGVFFEPAFLAANPDLEVTLELKMYNPANEEENYVIGETYTFRTAPIPTATITEIAKEDLTFAMNFKADKATDAQLDIYGDWYADFELTVNKGVTFNANGGADGYLSGQYDAWSENWVNVPFENITLKAGETLKIMEFAAKMMNQSGLKLTYADVYNSVKDFDCGVFFEPAFLEVNPDLEVTLELKMYNPANEEENYVIGDSYTFVGEGLVAKNMETGKVYGKVDVALAEAKEGQTVKLVNSPKTNDVVLVSSGVTFDLNGYEIKPSYVACFGDIIDSSYDNSGLLAIENNILIQKTNAQLPVKVEGGYKLVDVNRIASDFLEKDSKRNDRFVFQPFFEKIAHGMLVEKVEEEYIVNESVEIIARVSWKNSNGERTQDFIYNDEIVTTVINSYKPASGKYGQMFNLSLKNAPAELTYQAVVKSETGVEFVSDEIQFVLPTATVSEIENENLTFALNFKANEANEAQLKHYGDWYADYVITFDKDITLNAEGTADGYLSGQYDKWSENWVNVPPSDVTLKANESLKIMEYAAKLMGEPGLKYTFKEIYELVNDFNCGIFLNADEEVKVTLELRMYDPENPEKGYTIGDTYTFTYTPSAVTTENKTLTTDNAEANQASALVAEGTKITGETLSLKVSEIENSASDVTLKENEELKSVDVHIEGIAADNTVPAIITVKELVSKGLNEGNLALYHVENGKTVEMKQVKTIEEVNEHNEFYYDPATGDVTMALATFSEVAVVSEPPKWEGKFDYTWYDASKTELTISNADQLAAFGAIVGGMDGQTQNSFTGKTVKLLADINLGDAEDENNPDIIFYPIGYNSDDGKYEKTGVAVTTGFYNFCGTFDGNGHTISNFYQNTWEMKGDNNYYDATLQYYRDGMGLFGKVYGGTVKNLTVDNFKSDGEYTTTGVIAAYADGATFENIAITNCNPRVYNIGNGGIVGCVGWYAKDANLKTTFKNITVDNSNKISALWGSYDVACGGIVGQYYPTSGQTSAGTPKNAGIHFENCHISAQMDVYNDVCGNYQYYAYRYAGMLIGSVRENETIDGHVYPKMDGITASGCTVHFGTWNDYYYCEIIDNTTASYTHDYQMSRLDEIKAINGTAITYLDGTTGTVPASGRANYVIVDYTKGHGTENATCYHFKDGDVWTHDMGGIQTGIDENGDGQDDLKEDKQHIYLEFNNLVTGYGWGVTSKGVGDLAGVTILDREVADSAVKFEKADTAKDSYTTESTVTIGELFKAATIDDEKLTIKGDKVQVTVSPVVDENGNVPENAVTGTYEADTSDWTKGTLTFSGIGAATITITDYYFCTPTTIDVTIEDKEPVEKFDLVFPNTDTYLYRVGNQNTVALGSLFAAKEGAEIGTVSVTVEALNDTAASGTYTSNATWTNGTIQFSGTGVVKVTIQDYNFCTPTELYLEVVDATNVTTYSELKDQNSVFLTDITMSNGGTYRLTGNKVLYGNGFTFNVKNGAYSAVQYDYMSYVIYLENSDLDNIKIEGAVYPEVGGTRENDYNRAIVMTNGDCKIQNSYISNGASPIRNGGNLELVNTTLKGGAYANLDLRNGHLILDSVTTVNQIGANDKYNEETEIVGMGIVVYQEGGTEELKITIRNNLTQYNYLSKTQADTYFTGQYPSAIKGIVFGNNFTDYQNNDCINFGIVSMNNYFTENDLVDERIDKAEYFGKTKSVSLLGQDRDCYVYSFKPVSTTFPSYDGYTTEGQGVIEPTVAFDFTEKNYVAKTDSSNDYCYADGRTVYISMDEGDTFNWDTSILAATKAGQNISYKVSMNGVDYTGKSIAFKTAGDYTITYTYADNNNYGFDKDGNITTYSKEYSETVKINVAVVKATAKHAEFRFGVKGTEYSAKTVTIGDKTYVMPDVTATVSGKIGSKTVNGITVYYPITEMYTSDGETEHTGSWYACFPIFKDALQIIDYADQGTGDAVTYDQATVTTVAQIPSTLKAVDPKTAFLYSMNATNYPPPTDPTAVNGVVCYTCNRNGLTSSNTRNEENTVAEYTYTDNAGTVYYYYIGYHCAEQTSGGCFVEGTMITMADGTQKAVENLNVGDMVLAFNHVSGKLEAMPIIFNNHADQEADEYEVLHLEFANGENVKIVESHGFFDMTLMQYVYVDYENYTDFIGHEFYYAGNDGTSAEKVVLKNAYITEETVRIFCPVSYFHMNSIANGFLNTPNIPGDITGLVNYFEYDPDLKYNEEAMQRDIEKYGLYSYDDFKDYISEGAYNSSPSVYLKVAVGKGMITFEQILDVIDYLLAGSLIQ